LKKIVAGYLPFEFCLTGFGIFESAEVLYLKPEPEALFLSLFHEIKKIFKELQSAFDPPVIHLTVSHEEKALSMDALKREFLRLEGVGLPLTAKASRLELYEKKSGVWLKISEFSF
jgi:hypothetical protein